MTEDLDTFNLYNLCCCTSVFVVWYVASVIYDTVVLLNTLRGLHSQQALRSASDEPQKCTGSMFGFASLISVGEHFSPGIHLAGVAY